MTAPRPSEFKPELYDDIAPGYYDEVYSRGKGVQWFWHRHRFAAVADLIPPAGGAILDMGCGPGTFLAHFATGYRSAVGIDLAEPQIAYARRTYASDCLSFEAVNVGSFKGGEQFDAIVSIEVIEHLPAAEAEQFLQSIFRLLKSGGTLVLTTPNYRSLWPPIEWIISKKGPVNYLEQHINRFDVNRLAHELEKAGFVVLNKRTFFVIAPFLAAISRRLAEAVYAVERHLLPWLGSEIVISVCKP
ncbi:MAG TPA: class I SAM-dependent methyltransferase [Thermoanaerobaculia bacterium]